MLPSKARKGPRAVWACLLLLSLFHLPAGGALVVSAQEGGRDSFETNRLSPELERLAQSQAATNTVRVIIQARTGKRRSLGDAVIARGGVVLDELSLVNAVVAEVPAGSLRDLAE